MCSIAHFFVLKGNRKIFHLLHIQTHFYLQILIPNNSVLCSNCTHVAHLDKPGYMCFTTPWRASKNYNNLQFKEPYGQLDSSPQENLHVPVIDLLCRKGLLLDTDSSKTNVQP